MNPLQASEHPTKGNPTRALQGRDLGLFSSCLCRWHMGAFQAVWICHTKALREVLAVRLQRVCSVGDKAACLRMDFVALASIQFWASYPSHLPSRHGLGPWADMISNATLKQGKESYLRLPHSGTGAWKSELHCSFPCRFQWATLSKAIKHIQAHRLRTKPGGGPPCHRCMWLGTRAELDLPSASHICFELRVLMSLAVTPCAASPPSFPNR